MPDTSAMDFKITPPKIKTKRRTDLFLLVLKPLMCVLCPFLVPIIVYSVEGCTTPFWWTVGFAFVISGLLLSFNSLKTKAVLEYLKTNRREGIRCLLKASLLLLMCGGCSYAYQVQYWEIFCACVFFAGLITGTLFSDIAAFWEYRKKSGNLPYINVTKSSPEAERPSYMDLSMKLSYHLSSPPENSPLKSTDPALLSEMRQSNATVQPATTPVLPVSIEYHRWTSSSSSSGDSDRADIPQQPTPTKRRVISPGLISLSPLTTDLFAPETLSLTKRCLEFPSHVAPSPLRSPTPSRLPTTPPSTYAKCKIDNLLSQNFSFFHI